jgi:hypothetical protein
VYFDYLLVYGECKHVATLKILPSLKVRSIDCTIVRNSCCESRILTRTETCEVLVNNKRNGRGDGGNW